MLPAGLNSVFDYLSFLILNFLHLKDECHEITFFTSTVWPSIIFNRLRTKTVSGHNAIFCDHLINLNSRIKYDFYSHF